VCSEYSVAKNLFGGQPPTAKECHHGTHRTHGKKTGEEDRGMETVEELLSFSVCSEYSVVKNLFGCQRPTA
jgi:hypothetical protein